MLYSIAKYLVLFDEIVLAGLKAPERGPNEENMISHPNPKQLAACSF